ncbi:hypothetical protein Nepgr_028847 [Nepenthes gracilis]|uniref:Uncharacterized protein n=1 Tax=Nepenthes gracilis TaxID=150966 RepID=A0AAD3TDM6_NEPGR|nr:hypothetical protein Nepgr_028847 [Nepenthes gracilis]
MERNFISKETIKPSIPTPPHLKTYKFSSFDQVSPNFYVPILLFYHNQDTNGLCEVMKISSIIKESLSKILNRYYPFAGRIKDKVSIDCNDAGVVFSVFHFNNKQVDILAEPNIELFDMLFSDALPWNDNEIGNLLDVCVSFFACGGFSIGLCISHKIADACTLQTFLNDWATMTRKPYFEQSYPYFLSEFAFPPNDHLVLEEFPISRGKNPMTTRFVFSPLKIANLKAKVLSDSKVHNPTRVEVATSIIYKCVFKALMLTSFRSLSPSALVLVANLRRRVTPSLPDNSVGNAAWFFSVPITEEKMMKIDVLVAEMRKGLNQFCEHSRSMKGNQWFSMLSTAPIDSNCMTGGCCCTSWCRLPFYEADFGWGKPLWVCIPKSPFSSSIILLDSKDGEGIEAWVTLEEQVMSILEGDEEFLEHALVNPCIIDS